MTSMCTRFWWIWSKTHYVIARVLCQLSPFLLESVARIGDLADVWLTITHEPTAAQASA